VIWPVRPWYIRLLPPSQPGETWQMCVVAIFVSLPASESAGGFLIHLSSSVFRREEHSDICNTCHFAYTTLPPLQCDSLLAALYILQLHYINRTFQLSSLHPGQCSLATRFVERVPISGRSKDFSVRFEILTILTIKSPAIFWEETPCSVAKVYTSFGGTYCFPLQVQNVNWARRQAEWVECEENDADISSGISPESTNRRKVKKFPPQSVQTVFEAQPSLLFGG
jgi:hypothetical protein